MQQRLFTRASDDGFTVVELLVASTLGLMVTAMALAAVLANREVYKHDVVRTRINQNLRSALAIIGMNARQAGEALPAFFPAVEIVDHGTEAPDELYLRRNLRENEILNVCETLTANTSSSSVRFAYPTTEIACDYASELVPYLAAWNAYRTQRGGSASAYIYNRTARQGEFFTFNNMSDTGTEMFVLRSPGSWQYSYPGDGLTAAMYLLQEYHFRVENGILQLIENREDSNILNVVDGITNFQATARMQDGSTLSSFTANEPWTGIQYIEITISGQDTFAGRTVSSVLTSRMFPRNILSH